MISSATTDGPHTFAASAYFTQYKVDRNWATPTFAASAYCVQYKSIACEAANGHTCYYYEGGEEYLRASWIVCRVKKEHCV